MTYGRYLQTTFRNDETIPILRLTGSLDGHNFLDLEKRLNGLLENSPSPHLILELDGLNFIASTGIGCMISTHQTLTNRGGGLHLSNQRQWSAKSYASLDCTALPDLSGHRQRAGNDPRLTRFARTTSTRSSAVFRSHQCSPETSNDWFMNCFIQTLM